MQINYNKNIRIWWSYPGFME